MTDRNFSRRTKSLLALLLILPFIFLASGCNENRGQSKAASADAATVSENRLNGAVSSLQETLGQKPAKAPDRPTLRWEAPETREDGSRLYASDIKEYRIYYRLRHQNGFQTLSQPAGRGTAFTLNQFQPGAYEFSVTAVDREGRESRRSDGVSVNLI